MHARNYGSELKSRHRTSDQGNPLTFIRLASDRPPAACPNVRTTGMPI